MNKIKKHIGFLLVILALLTVFVLLAGHHTNLVQGQYVGSEGSTMQSYQEFFTNNPNGVMGTVDNNEARTRTFQVLWIEDNRLYFCTGNHKPVYEQMKANPKVSFTALNSDTLESVSVCGTVVFVNDIDGKTRALEENPGIKDIYESPHNPKFELLYTEVTDVPSFIFSNDK